jgi:hypothetical protein
MVWSQRLLSFSSIRPVLLLFPRQRPVSRLRSIITPLIQCAEHQSVRRHRKTGVDIHSRRFAADVPVAFHVPLAVVIHPGRVLHRENNRFVGHPFDGSVPVRLEYFTPVELFVPRQVINRCGL